MPSVIQTSSTRRRLLQGAGAAGVAVTAGRALPAAAATIPTDERPDVTHRGRALAVTPRGTHLVLAHAARHTLVITARRTGRARTVTLTGQPLELALSPDGRQAAVTTAFWDHPGLTLVPVAGGAPGEPLDVGPAPHTPVFTHDGRHLLVSGGEQAGTLRILGGAGLLSGRTVGLGRVPRGVVVAADDAVAWVAVQGDDAVQRVDLRTGKVTRTLAVPALPDRLALAPDGRTLLVSHGGQASARISEVDVRTGKVRRRNAGGQVSAVAWTRGGRRLAALFDRDAVAVLDAGRRRVVPTVTAPRSISVAGSHAFTVSAVDAAVGRVRA